MLTKINYQKELDKLIDHLQKEEKQACNRSTGSSADSGVRKRDDQCGE